MPTAKEEIKRMLDTLPDDATWARRITWTESAWQELECAASFIARDSPRYAAALIAEAKSTARSLRKSSMRGHIVPERNDATVRELFVKSYRLILKFNRTES